MIPESTDLTAEAQQEIEDIDQRLNAMEEETQRLLDRRSELIEQES